MSFKIATIKNFDREAKALRKRYRSFAADYARLLSSLKADPHQGVEVRKGFRKVRLAVTSKGKGKSGGARVITYDTLVAERDGVLYLVSIYDKADYSTVSEDLLPALLAEAGIECNDR